jgi:hypothetical protein
VDSAISSAISEDLRSGFMPDIVNNPELVPHSSVKSTEPFTRLSASETIQLSPLSLLVEFCSHVRNCQGFPDMARLSNRNERSLTVFGKAWSSLSPTCFIPVVALVATIGLFVFTAVWPVLAVLFPHLCRPHRGHSQVRSDC